MIIHRDFEQGSDAWMRARCEIPTASEFKNLVTPLGKVKTGQGPMSYLAEKLAQKWTGGPLAGFSSWATEQGSIMEEKAIPGFEFEYGIKIERVPFITTDDGKVGCSPDGLIGDDSGIEIKCPQPDRHVEYLLAGVVPADYILQVQGAMWVTGRKNWTFFSFCPKFPDLVVHVRPDPDIQEGISDALALFLTRMDCGWEKLCELNGGPPPPPPPAATERIRFSWEQEQDPQSFNTDPNEVPT